MIGIDYPIINLVTSVVENVVGLHHPWILSPKEIQILLCLCTVVCRLLLMMMMFLIERSKCDDDDVAIDRKIKVLKMLLIKSSKC